MLYGGKSLKCNSPPNICITQPISSQLRPNAFLAKQPAGNHHKIRLARDERRMRTDWLRIKNEDSVKSTIRRAAQNKCIEMADTKHLYNQIKQMVDCEMRANEHLFIEQCPEPELQLEQVSGNSKIPVCHTKRIN